MADATLAEPLRITTRPADDRVVRLAVSGVVDLATAPTLRSTVLASIHAADRPEGVELDLGETTFLDAVGVRVLVDSWRAAARSRIWFGVRNPRGMVAQVLALAGVAELLGGVAAPAG